MPDPITLGALLVAAVTPLYAILKRHFDVENANLASRIKLARELRDACDQWSVLLEQTFDRAIDYSHVKGPEPLGRRSRDNRTTSTPSTMRPWPTSPQN